MKKTFVITTDANGFYHKTDTFSPPAPFGFHVDTFATVQSSPDLQFAITVELDSGEKSQSKSLVTSTGQKNSLGAWFISKGDNILVISGQTTPSAPNAPVSIDVEADLTF